MSDNEKRIFVLTEDNQIAIKVQQHPYAVLEMNSAEEFSHIQTLLAKDAAISVDLVRESSGKVEFCTAFCPRCKTDIFMKRWSERDSWVLPKFCGECGQKLNWNSLRRGDWMAL